MWVAEAEGLTERDVPDTAARLWQVSRMLDSWEGLVDQVECGYEFNIEEYTHDLAVRDGLDAAVDSVPPDWPRGRLAELDRRFRATLAPEAVDSRTETPWWRAQVPRLAGEQLAADLVTRYGIAVETRD